MKPKFNHLNSVVIIGAMIFYGIVFQWLGFVLCNLLFLFVLLRFVWMRSWRLVLPAAFLIDGAFYLLFQVLLDVRVPLGLLEQIFYR